jgi:acyl-CoA thioesterase-1
VTYVETFAPLRAHEQWLSDLGAGDGVHPGQAGYGLMAWLVLHNGWHAWLDLDAD